MRQFSYITAQHRWYDFPDKNGSKDCLKESRSLTLNPLYHSLISFSSYLVFLRRYSMSSPDSLLDECPLAARLHGRQHSTRRSALIETRSLSILGLIGANLKGEEKLRKSELKCLSRSRFECGPCSAGAPGATCRPCCPSGDSGTPRRQHCLLLRRCLPVRPLWSDPLPTLVRRRRRKRTSLKRSA